MENELEFIKELMKEKFDIKILKKITKKIEDEKNEEHLSEIIENKNCPNSAVFYLSTKHIEVNYEKMLKHAIQYANQINNSYGITKSEFKIIEILTAYRIFLHEIHHSKQIYNAFDTDAMDPETEIVRSILNFKREEYLEELKTKTRKEIIEEKTCRINNIIMPYSEINPMERTAEIESLKKIRNIIEPMKDEYKKIYDEIYYNELLIKIYGYKDYGLNIPPYIQTLEIIKRYLHITKINLPYNTNTYKDALNELNKQTTEQERLELGLDIKPYTLQKEYNKIYTLENNI